MKKIYYLSFLIFILGCKKDFAPPANPLLDRVTIASVQLGQTFLDYALLRNNTNSLSSGKNSFASSLNISSGSNPGNTISTWTQVLGGIGYFQFIPIGTPGITITDSVNLQNINQYSKSLGNNTYNVFLKSKPETQAADTFIRFQASDSSVVISGNTALVLNAITQDGLITILASQIKPGTVPTLNFGPAGPSFKFGLQNGYYYLYVKGYSDCFVNVIGLNGQPGTKEIGVSSNIQYNLSLVSSPQTNTTHINFSPFSQENAQVLVINFSVSRFAGAVTPFNPTQGIAGNLDGPRLNAEFNCYYSGLATDQNGNVYLADKANNSVRKIDASTGIVSTLSGVHHFGPQSTTGFYYPQGIAIDKKGNVFVSSWYDAINKIDPQGNVSPIAGTGGPGYSDGFGYYASFNNPADITFDKNGNLYVLDQTNGKIRKIDTNRNVSTVNTIPGTITLANGFSFPATNIPDLAGGLTVDNAGNVYTFASGVMLKMDPTGKVTVFSNYAGVGLVTDKNGYFWSMTQNTLNRIDPLGNVMSLSLTNNTQLYDYEPLSLAIDPQGNLYFANNEYEPTIQKITFQ